MGNLVKVMGVSTLLILSTTMLSLFIGATSLWAWLVIFVSLASVFMLLLSTKE